MNTTNYYEVLGLKPTCTPHEIKKSYRQLALIWHPDKHNNKKDAQIQFTSINEAYNVLIDASKREIYDKYGHDGLNPDQGVQNKTNGKMSFCQKGFYGTEKSAFDVLKDIFFEKDDDDFFENCNLSNMCNNMKTNVQSFVFEHIIASDGEGSNFFTEYIPTFMNNTFTSSFSSLFAPEGDSNQFFSSFFASSFEPELSSKDEKIGKNSRKYSGYNVEINEEKATKRKNKNRKGSININVPPNLSKKNRKNSFMTSGGEDIIEEEFYMEIKIVDHKRHLNDVKGQNDHEAKGKKKRSKNLLGKRKCGQGKSLEGRKKVKH